MTDSAPETLQADNASLQMQIKRLEAARDITIRLGQVLDLPLLALELVGTVTEWTHFRRAMLFVLNDWEMALTFSAISGTPPADETTTALRNAAINIYNVEDDPIVSHWLRGDSLAVSASELPEHSTLGWVAKTLQMDTFFSLPVRLQNRIIAVIILDKSSDTAAAASDAEFLEAVAPSMAVLLENARVHSITVQELATKMRELYILRQIDRELNETIAPNHVYSMTLDWALRFTNAHAAALALYNEDTEELRLASEVGYDLPDDQVAMAYSEQGGTAQRIARSGRGEIIPDVSMDKDYLRLANTMRSQICVPVIREDQVIAVISIESRKLNAFGEDHLDFVEKLASRAAVAIDNARLFSETVREREKLSRILSNIADVVIVVNPDGRLEMVNQSAIAAMRLYADESYVGLTFSAVFEHTPLFEIFRQAQLSERSLIGEVLLPGDRTFHTNLTFYEGVGWIIFMHDITPLKETDRLKNELVATVSHDLKQPLSVMNGYSELLMMRDTLDPQTTGYLKMMQRSIVSMRQLIDDLLNLAKIESGIQLSPKPVSLQTVITQTMQAVKPSADFKAMEIEANIPDGLPNVKGEQSYLNQIFTNLVSNAVKYTPPEGSVRIWAEQSGPHVRVAVQDNGLGISPEDQAHIFDRFYRVRRPETDSIDGTGLGLAIVKRLIEVHNGQIGLESHLGEGSTFYVTLPIYQD
jgi:signal transduction histidine kinase